MIGLLGTGLLNAQVASTLYNFERDRATGDFQNNGWNVAPDIEEHINSETVGNVLTLQQSTLSYLGSDNKMERADLLMTSYQNAPSDKALWPYVLVHYGMSGDEASLRDMAEKMNGNGLIPEEQKSFHRLLLAEMDGKDVVISHGLWDTATLLMVNSETGGNVSIICLDWFRDPLFRSTRMQSMGLVAPDVKSSASETLIEFQNRNPEFDIHLAPTLNKTLLGDLEGRLSLTGLSFSMSKNEDASAEMLSAWQSLKNEKETEEVFASSYRPWHRNYLPLLIRMETFFGQTGQLEDVRLCREWMNEITDGLGIPRIPKR